MRKTTFIVSLMLLIAILNLSVSDFVYAQEIEYSKELNTVNNDENLDIDFDDNNQDAERELNDNDKESRDFSNIVRQTTEYTCGPAALATLIIMLGGNADEMQLAKISGTTEESGTSMLALKKVAADLGYKVSLKNVKLGNITKYKLPILAHENNKENGDHYVVIKEVAGNVIKIADPSAGNIELEVEEFENSFTGKVLTLSLPSEVKNGQSADVALQVLEENNIELTDSKGNVLNIDELQDELSEQDAESTKGKFVQILIIPVAEIGTVIIIGSMVAYSGYLSYMFSKSGKSKKNVEKGIREKVGNIKKHEEKIRKNPNSRDRNHWEKEIKEWKNQIKNDLKKARNKFKNNFDWNF